MGKKASKGRITGRKTTEKKTTGHHCENETENDNHVKSTTSREMAAETVEDDVEHSVFPRRTCWIIFAWTLVSRLWYVTTPTNWWIMHPDEIYQTIEVAHTDAFGYGFKPFEYWPPPGKFNFSVEHERHIKHGMYSLRSFLLVKVFSAVMLLADAVGVTASPFLVIKCFHVILTSYLPLAVFKFTKALYTSHDIATLAAISTGLSFSLNLLGTHTFINSFISPLLFASLTPLVSALNRVRRHHSLHSLTCTNKNKAGELYRNYSSEPCNTSANGSVTDQELYRNSLSNGHVHKNGFVNGFIHVNGHANGHLPDQKPVQETVCNGHSVITNGVGMHSGIKSSNGVYGQGSKPFLDSDVNANTVEKDWNCHNDKLHIRMKERTTNTSSQIINNGAKRGVLTSQAMYGVLLGICIYMRTDTIIIPAVLCLLYITDILKNVTMVVLNVLEYLLGVAFGMVIGGYVDSVTYGVWFISVKQWFKFNVVEGFSATLFGTLSSRFYVDWLFNQEPLAVVVCSFLLLDVIVFNFSCKSNASKSNNIYLATNTSFAFCAILVVYTSFGHKELRFLHNGIVFLYISLARAVYNMCHFLSFTQNQNQYLLYGRAIYLLFTVLIASHIYSFFNMDVDAVIRSSYNRPADAGPNMCMDFIRKQTDVNGVFIEKEVYDVGGYSLLHKDVPLFVLAENEFNEYDKKITDSRYFSQNIGSGFSSFIRISDLISVFNGHYLLKVLISRPKYNYIVIHTNKRFIEIGYKEIFRTETARVLKRTFLKNEEAELASIADTIPMGINATILEYEGHWLRHFGVYQKAEERLLFANRVDETRLGPFQILMEIYKRFNSKDNFQSVLKSCKEHHKEGDCLKPYAPFRLIRNIAR